MAGEASARDLEILYASGRGRLLLWPSKKEPTLPPRVRIIISPYHRGHSPTQIEIDRWNQSNRYAVDPGSFFQALNDGGLRVVTDEGGYFHVVYQTEEKARRREGGQKSRPRPFREKRRGTNA